MKDPVRKVNEGERWLKDPVKEVGEGSSERGG